LPSGRHPWLTTALVVILLLSQAVWVGGLVVIAVVARVARRILTPQQQVDFFKRLGRAYGPVGGLALTLALLTGGVLARKHPWNRSMASSTLVAAALVMVTVAGVVQARRMSRLRQGAIEAPDEVASSRIAGDARLASCLRGLIALLTLALLCLAATLLS
jgi:uncharacterized membrane protein